MTKVALLGPQRLRPTLSGVVDRLEIDGPIGAITAGWQERESEDEEMRDHLGRRVVNLELYRRSEDVQTQDPDLFQAHRRRQDQLRALQRLYRPRLTAYMAAARDLMTRRGEPSLLLPEREDAIQTVRDLDHHHLARIRECHEEFDEAWRPQERSVVQRHRDEMADILDGCSAVAIAGGHVAILLNRLRMFGVLDLLENQAVIAWSAGAMAISEQIVLFHDSPPQGPGDAEVLEVGLGLAKGVVPLPHARRRLRLDDPVRVAVLARRFEPAKSVAMDEEAFLVSEGGGWRSDPATRQLTRQGNVVPVEDSL
jgi:hypothetical protein